MAVIVGGGCGNNRRIMMFSCTFSEQAQAAAARYLENDHIRVTIGRVGSSHRNIRQNIMWIDEDKKIKALIDLLMSLPACRVMIFCNTLRTVELVDDELFQYRLPVTSIHSNRTQREREDAL
jgi:ATP-dependent RNA helicase DDX3X